MALKHSFAVLFLLATSVLATPYGMNGKGGYSYNKRSAVPLCPGNLEACPISGLSSSDYECLDTTTDPSSCGGCPSIGEGQDCTTIKGAQDVSCRSGSCTVFTCEAGYLLALDGKFCNKT